MSQLVPFLNFGLEDYQTDADYFYGYEPPAQNNPKMVSGLIFFFFEKVFNSNFLLNNFSFFLLYHNF